MPNTPNVLPSEPKLNLSKIKSLSKLDIRSPVIFGTGSSNTNALERVISNSINEQTSLYTSQTNGTVASKLLSIGPKAIYALRNYYNDFTTIDWAKAYISTNRFNYELEKNKWIANPPEKFDNSYSSIDELSGNTIPLYYKSYLVLGKWILIVIIGFVFSLIAFLIDKFEILLVGFKHGYCRTNWFASQVSCCANTIHDSSSGTIPQVMLMNLFKSGYLLNTKNGAAISESCPDWVSWSNLFETIPFYRNFRFDFLIYVVLTVILAHLACIITLSTKLTGGVFTSPSDGAHSKTDENTYDSATYEVAPRIMYTACGSGVPEVKTILSGFVIRRFLGTYALITKTASLILAIASGMSLGKEGPYVHLATAVGNIASRFFPFIDENDLLKKQILSASASAGVALAFGSPLGGVLFILEEINHYLPSHQLFQIFFCAIISTLFLKFLNPYGTGKTVLFELKYSSDWNTVELIFFIIIGIAGGIFGACFVKFVEWWPKKFRSLKLIKDRPIFEVFCIAMLTGLVTFWNPYTKQASSELVMDLATPCGVNEIDRSLCPTTTDQYFKEFGSLLFAFTVKVILTFVTFGLKLPCGIYVPSMIAGALYGRMFAMIIQWFNLTYNLNITNSNSSTMGTTTTIMRFICSKNSTECVDLGIYSMISAGAFMAGVTRMNITLVTILFELTSSYTYVLPISISIAVANWAGSMLEKNSLYESILISNDYPFMSSETEAINPFTTAGDIIHDIDTYNEKEENELPETPTSASLLPEVEISRVEQLTDEDNNKLYIDLTESPYVTASVLQAKFILLLDQCLLDGCLPLIKNQVCVGLIYFSELEFCLDKLKEFSLKYEVVEEIYCKLLSTERYEQTNDSIRVHEKHNASVIHRLYEERLEIDYFNYGSVMTLNPDYLELSALLDDMTNLVKYVDCSPIFINNDSELSFAHLIFDRIGNRVIVLLKNGHYYGVLHKKVLIDFCRREG
ncbi:chloride channel [Scheffersomyces xylosifermentans]|uniref:chloride channel n=1 Tax=Scheffersomyces xylosifermentans TaxID=1304137 RepID=UPI00315DAED3